MFARGVKTDSGALDPDHRDDSMAFRVISDRPNNRNFSGMAIWKFNQETGHEESSFRGKFLILEGECECDFLWRYRPFKTGDYFGRFLAATYMLFVSAGILIMSRGLCNRLHADQFKEKISAVTYK